MIGKASGIKVKDGRLIFDEIQFSKTNPLATLTFNLIKEGILKTVSVGFIVNKWGDQNSKYTIDGQGLLELSWVAVPANPRAMSQEQLAMLETYKKSLEEVKPEETPEPEPKKIEETRKKKKNPRQSHPLKTK